MFQAAGSLSLVLPLTLIWVIFVALLKCYPVLSSWQKGTFWLLKTKPHKKLTVISSCLQKWQIILGMLASGFWLAKSRGKRVIPEPQLVLRAANCWSPGLPEHLSDLVLLRTLFAANDRHSTKISKVKIIFIGSLSGEQNL